MDYGSVVSDSIAFTREALAGTWITWLILIICGIPLALLNFIIDPNVVTAGGIFHGDLVPWTEVGVLFAASILLSFLIYGYLVRIYRGAAQPPVFDAWISLFIDGIKLMVVCILWFIPALVIFFGALISIALDGKIPVAAGGSFVIVGFLLLFIGFIVFVISMLCSVIGCVRFARMGSIREGLRFSAIIRTIQAIGWGNYLFALVIGVVILLVFKLVGSLLSLIPVAGVVIGLALYPVVQVFFARYVCLIYDQGIPAAPAPVQ
jgi:hypothetical protein